jgi:hypothetical protein
MMVLASRNINKQDYQEERFRDFFKQILRNTRARNTGLKAS